MNFQDMIARLFTDYWRLYLAGTGFTILLAVIGTVAGFAIGLGVGVVRCIPLRTGGQTHISPRSAFLRIINAILAIYIEVFRGTPMIVQAVLVYYGLPEFLSIDIDALPAAMLVITLNTGAYMSEIVRGGIYSVDSGQSDAAKAIGMTHWKTMIHVVLPQTIRNILPAAGNEFVVNLKDSSVLNVITVGELFYVTNTVKGIFYRTYEPFLIAACIYLSLTFISSRLLRYLENKMDGTKNFTVIASSTMPEMLKKPGQDRR